MLGAPQRDVCLTCHGSRAGRDRAVREGLLAPGERPALLGSVLAEPYVHPVSDSAFSRHELGAVTCTSCHSPHRQSSEPSSSRSPSGRRRVSPRNPNRFEYQLCQECHGNRGATTTNLSDLSRQLNPGNRSYHPVEAPARESSPSLVPSMSGGEINCTDCHGTSNPDAARGPHGSREAYLLSGRYSLVDGSSDASDHELCYKCHRRQALLDGSPFPEHGEHITEVRASCATCHSPHGSVGNRALIRFGEETIVAGVSPSSSTGRLAFISDAAGSGACYLTCHGVDHAPEAYGGLGILPKP